MPFLEPYEVRRLLKDRVDAEYELDLTGVTLAHAELAIARMLERGRFLPARTIYIKLDPATPTSGETLFKPVGRALVAAMRKGLVRRCNPVPAESGAGFFIETAGRFDAAQG